MKCMYSLSIDCAEAGFCELRYALVFISLWFGSGIGSGVICHEGNIEMPCKITIQVNW